MSDTFLQFDLEVKLFKVTMQSCSGEKLTQHQIGEVLLDLEQKINTLVLDSRNKDVLASARVHINIPVDHPIMRWPEENSQP
jgi:hypothetical protein